MSRSVVCPSNEEARATYLVVSGREVTMRDGGRSDDSRFEGVHDSDSTVIADRAGENGLEEGRREEGRAIAPPTGDPCQVLKR